MRDGYVVTWRGREYDASPDGDKVRIYAPEPGEGFEEVRPGRYVTAPYEWRLLDDAGHFLHQEQPDVVTGEILRWLKTTD